MFTSTLKWCYNVLLIRIRLCVRAVGGIAPCKYLSPHPPPASLTCFETLASLLTFIGLQTVYLAGMWTYLHAQPWYATV